MALKLTYYGQNDSFNAMAHICEFLNFEDGTMLFGRVNTPNEDRMCAKPARFPVSFVCGRCNRKEKHDDCKTDFWMCADHWDAYEKWIENEE